MSSKRRHDEIWPEFVTELKGAGLSNYSLLRFGDERVVGYVECEPDAQTCFGTLAQAPGPICAGARGLRRSSWL